MNALNRTGWGLLGGLWGMGVLSADAGQPSFRVWRQQDHVTLVMDVRPGPEDGKPGFREDAPYILPPGGTGLRYEVRFEGEFRVPHALTRQPLAYASLPPVTSLDGPGADGLLHRQRYTVTEIRGGVRTELQTAPMFAVPPDLGPKSMPRYAELAVGGVYALSNGGRVVAGRREAGLPAVLSELWGRAPADKGAIDTIALEIPLVRVAEQTR